MAKLSNTSVEQLREKLRGEVICPGDPGFDSARTIWNAMIDRRPAVIARCAGVADVRHSIQFARAQDLPLAVRGGGHNIAGNAVCDDGLMIDLSPMRSVTIDPESRHALVEPGATLRDFDHEAQEFGLATPLGINSTTGVAGLTLGGGFGWLTRKYGLTVDNLVAADVVTADGRLLRASADQRSDLFWAIRGGGGNFGVVTLFEFALHRVGPTVLAGLIVFPLDQGRAVLEKYRAFAAQAPDDLSVWAVLRKAPPLPFLPADVHGRNILALAICYVGDVEEGKRLVEPIRRFATAYGEHVGPMPYAAWQQAFDPLLTPRARNYWKSHNFTELRDELLDLVIDFASRVPSPHSEVFIGQLGGQAARVPKDATAYPHRDAGYVMNVHGRWETPGEDEAGIAWARGFFQATAPYATGGVYVNFMTQDEEDRVAAAYGGHYDRLVQVKDKYDPQNVFRLNQNIKPSVRQRAGASRGR
jgi:FAD/FMN-containing dehydrogenase